jgi:protein O-mannosyl-transferase
MSFNVKRETWISALLALLIGAVYWRVSQNEFIMYDDPDYVLGNPIVKRGLTTDGIRWAFANVHTEHTYWHPITWLSHMLDVQLFALIPGAHHLINVLFHAANAILLFLLLKQLTGAVWRSAIVAAFFALHPLQLDTVAWVSERKNLLSALFWILTTISYVRYARSGKWSSYGITILLFALGLMCKPVLVTLPFTLILLDFWPLGRTDLGAKDRPARGLPISRVIVEKIPLFVLSGISSWLTIAAHQGLQMIQEADRLSLSLRIQNAFVSYARYLGKIFWPSDLAIAYPHPGVWPTEQVVGSVLLVLVVTAAVLLKLKLKPYLAIGWCWFLGTLVPVSGLVQVGTQSMADRFAYVPVIGVFIMAVWGYADWARTLRNREAALKLAGGLAILGCITLTSFQLTHWKNSETVFSHAAKVTKDNYVAHYNLSVILSTRGRMDEALLHAAEALRINPQGHRPLFVIGQAHEWQNDVPAAISNYQRCVDAEPDWHAARKALANALSKQGAFDAANAHFLKLIEVTPGDADVYVGLAQISVKRREAEAAIKHYRRALELKPDSPAILNNLAWLLATYPDARFRNGPEAVRLAERACDVSRRKLPFLLGTLAAAYAEAGRFSEAVHTADEARQLAAAGGDNAIAEANAKLLELYRANTPYHETQNPL